MRYFLMGCVVLTASVVKAASVAFPDQAREVQIEYKEYGVVAETPNQRRIREGKPLVASFPAMEAGERLETPNDRRRRLGQPLPAEAELGQAIETPNQHRERLASRTASLR